MTILETLLFGLVVLITHFIEGITGFGCTVLALPFCSSLAGIKVAVPVLVIIAWLLALYIIIIDFRKIIWREYIKIIAFVILGLPIGMWLFGRLPEAILKKLLGAFMIIVAIRGLYAVFMSKRAEGCCGEAMEGPGKRAGIARYKSVLLNFVLFLGGVIHGAFGSGGPFIVIYAAKALPDKSNFRATISMLWLTLNSIIIIRDLRGGVMSEPVLKIVLWTLPFLAIGMVLGNYAHKKIRGNSFVKLVYGVLLLSGVFMLL
ncbi:MAG: sulfite exporter TauE/SafE family protein [Clostridiaceae bacterium]